MKSALEDAAGRVFQRALEDDRPDDAVAGAWRVLETGEHGLEDDYAVPDSLPPLFAAAVASLQSCAVAVVARDGSIRFCDHAFERWIGEPAASPTCSRLVRTARVEGRAFGLVETLEAGVLAVCAANREWAARWPLDDLARAALERTGALALLAYAPSRSSDLVQRAARAFGLSGLEARVAEALLEAPSLEVAARNLGVGRETAKDALASAMRKAGVSRSAQLLGRIVDLSCGYLGGHGASDRALGSALGLSASETRVALSLAEGATEAEAASALGLSTQTIKSYRKAVFLKTGVNRTRDLRRLMTETAELVRLADAAEVSIEAPSGQEQLRIIIGRDGRRVAFNDYGPVDGRPILVGHGFATGRRIPPPLVRGLRGAGYRPIAPQRPGFGLTDPASGDYVEAAADDMADVLDSLGRSQASLLGREGGGAAFMAFGVRHPARVERGLLLNPRSPLHAPLSGVTVGDRLSRALMQRPEVIGSFSEVMRRQTRTDLLQRIVRHVYSGVAIDRELIGDPELMAWLVRDIQSLMSRTTVGVAAEHRAYAEGWRIPAEFDAAGWTMAYSGELWTDDDVLVWRETPGLKVVEIAGAGLLAQFTHVDALLALLG